MAEIILSMADTSLLAAMITFIVAGITFKLAVVIGCGHFFSGQDPFCSGLDNF